MGPIHPVWACPEGLDRYKNIFEACPLVDGMSEVVQHPENSFPKCVIPICPPRVDSSKAPNRVNRAHWPTKENSPTHTQTCLHVFGPWKTNLNWHHIKPGVFFLLMQTMPTFWATRILILRLFIFICWGIPILWIFISPDFQTPPALADKLSDPNLTPLPTHPAARSPCCDIHVCTLGS